jgi:hypothetical protein
MTVWVCTSDNLASSETCVQYVRQTAMSPDAPALSTVTPAMTATGYHTQYVRLSAIAHCTALIDDILTNLKTQAANKQPTPQSQLPRSSVLLS